MALSPLILYGAAVFLAAAGAAFLYLTVRTNASKRPEGALEWMAAGLSLLLVVAAAGLGFLAYSVDSGVSMDPNRRFIGQSAPELRFRLVGDDQERQLSDYAGKVIVLNLWATWCAPCLEELPALNRLQKQYGNELAVLTISDEPRQTLQDFEQTRPLQTVSGYLPDAHSFPYPYNRVESARPTSFVIDRQGVIQATWPGARSFSEFEQAVVPYL